MEKWGQNIKKEQCHGNVTNLVRILANFTFHLGEPTYLNSTMKTLEKGVYNIDTRTKLMTSFWFLLLHLNIFLAFFSVSIIDVEKVNVFWETYLAF